ncbi:MAG: PQQ-like beta-propeller repeat protein [Chloroflexi bacterium]|nr:PQQ-like beta-propeller repeat protein [Chloroflexota bacterium]
MRPTRRRLLTGFGELFVVCGAGLLAACQSQPQPITVTTQPAPAGATTAPAAAASPAAGAASPAAAAPSPAAATSPVPKPAAAASPSPSPGVVASASPSPSLAAGAVVGKPQYQMDALHTGRSPHTGTRSLAIARTFSTNQPDLRPEDALGPGPDVQSSTAIGPDGTIYATNFIGWLFALRNSSTSANALDLIWRFRPANGSPFHCTPALARDGNTVYVSFTTGTGGAARGSLFAVRAPASGQDGQVVWQADLGAGNVQNTPTLGPDGTLYIVNVAGVLSAIDSTSGNVKWTAQTGNGQPAQFGQTVKVAPAVAPDGTVYTTALTDGLYAISPPAGSGTQGSVKWTFNSSEHLGPTPLVTAPVTAPPNRGQDGVGSAASPTIGPDGTIYVGANNSNFYAIDPSGQQKWLYEAERELAGIWTTAALSGDASTVYFGANKGGIYALNTRDGSLKWQFNIVGSVYGSPALDAAGTLYTGSTVGHVFSLSTADGERITDLDLGAPVWSAPSIRPDGSVVVVDRNGRVVVLSS